MSSGFQAFFQKYKKPPPSVRNARVRVYFFVQFAGLGFFRAAAGGRPARFVVILPIPAALSIQKVLQLFAAAGVAQLAQGLGLDLADTLTGNIELLAHFLQRAGAAIRQIEAKALRKLRHPSRSKKLKDFLD